MKASLRISILLLVGLAALCPARTLYVDGTNGNDLWDGQSPAVTVDNHGPKQTILSAAMEAWGSDLIVVMDGVYTGEDNAAPPVFDLIDSKHLTLRSMNGPDACHLLLSSVIGFSAESGELPPTCIEGFTIQEVVSPGARLMIMGESNVCFTDCIFKNFYMTYIAGFIEIQGLARPVLEGCVFEANEAPRVLTTASENTVTLRDCLFQNNRSLSAAGYGLNVIHAGPFSQLVLENCTFRENTSAFGDLCCLSVAGHEAAARVSGCRFEDNYLSGNASYRFMGVCVTEAELQIKDSIIQRNTSWSRNPCTIYGIFCDMVRRVGVTGCRIVNNGALGQEPSVISRKGILEQEPSVISSKGILFTGGTSWGSTPPFPVYPSSTVSLLEVTDSEISGHVGQTGCGIFVENCGHGIVDIKTSRLCSNRGELGSLSGGIRHLPSPTVPLQIKNCVIADNYPCGVWCSPYPVQYPYSAILNCTVIDNWHIGLQYPNGLIRNTIVRGHLEYELKSLGESLLLVDYCNIEGGWVGPGIGNIDADPLFADAAGGDYHLKSVYGRFDPAGRQWVEDVEHSPCIDAGDPASAVGDEPLNSGGVINMGAYGGTEEASRSGLCTGEIYGDINRDCVVNLADMAILSGAWLESTEQAEP